jgi:hypothetical protein
MICNITETERSKNIQTDNCSISSLFLKKVNIKHISSKHKAIITRTVGLYRKNKNKENMKLAKPTGNPNRKPNNRPMARAVIICRGRRLIFLTPPIKNFEIKNIVDSNIFLYLLILIIVLGFYS